MENHKEKIINPQLMISEACTNRQEEIIRQYWAHNSNFEFRNTPTHIINEYKVKGSQLRSLLRKYSGFEFYLHCDSCNSLEWQKAMSQSNFNSTFSSLKKKHYKFQCEYCKEREYLRFKEERKKQDEERKEMERKRLMEKDRNHQLAIDGKVWNQLPEFENVVLKDAIRINDFQRLSRLYSTKGDFSYKKYLSALRLLNDKDLLILTFDSRNSSIIEKYTFSERLQQEYDFQFKEEKKILSTSEVKYDNQTDELKFRLPINKNQAHPDSPLYAGTVVFKERIIIEPGKEYVFGVWNRADQELFLSMVPLNSLYKSPIQKKLQSLPVPIRKGVEDFLNSIGKEWIES
jgi:hypothetical protein